MPTIQQANMEGNLIRSHMAKMMVNWAIAEMGMVPDTTKSCTFTDISVVSIELQGYITLACQLNIM